MKSISYPTPHSSASKLTPSGLLALLLAASVTLTACGGGSGTPSNALSGTPSDALVKASDNPVVRMRIRGAADAEPVHGSVSQSSLASHSFSVNVGRESNQLNYDISYTLGTETLTGEHDDFVKTDHLKGADETFSHTTLIQSAREGKSYIDVFTDYELPTALSSRTFNHGDLIPGPYSALTTGDAGTHSLLYTLNGVVGMMSCEGQCILTGGRVGGSGNYIFTPKPAPIILDTDYLVGGIWLWVDDKKDEDTNISVSASGNDPFGDSSGMGIRAVLGSATYSGRARGIFTNKRDDVIQPSKAFKADVNLMANFGSVGMGGTISGAVSNFTDANANATGFVITLGAAPIGTTNSGFFTGNTGFTGFDFTGTGVTGDVVIDDTGKWGGQFYGNPDASVAGNDAQPGSVAGTFGVNVDIDFGADVAVDDTKVASLSVLGVFGAYKSDETPVPGSGSGGENEAILTVSNTPAFLTASDAPVARMKIQAAANNAPLFGPLFGNVMQSSISNPDDTDTFKVVLPHVNGELGYKVEVLLRDGTEETIIDSAESETPQFRKVDGGELSHVDMKKEEVDENEGTMNHGFPKTEYIDIFTDYFTGYELPVTTVRTDTDYLAGGIWLSFTKYLPRKTWIGVSASGSDPFGDSSGMGIAAVTDSATYDGRARGIYVSSGQDNVAFDADVELMAEFGDAMATGMISGTVGEFTDADSGESLEAGVVTLAEATIDTANSGFFTGNTGVIDDENVIEDTGKWGGQFYGNPDASVVGNNSQPDSVAGTFGASVGDASSDDDAFSLLGFFWAYKEPSIPQ